MPQVMVHIPDRNVRVLRRKLTRTEIDMLELDLVPVAEVSATVDMDKPIALTALRFEGKPVRIIQDENGDPWFVAADVCRVLEIVNSRDAIRVLDPDEKGVANTDTLGGPQEAAIISEPGLYKLMGRSRKPEAKRFDRWVRHEVLPSIRKTGSYATSPAPTPMTREQIMASALLLADETMKEQAAQIAILVPKADALDRLATADGSLCVTDTAKALQMRPIDLFKYLSQNGWTYKRDGSDHWLGYQAQVLAGNLEHKVTTVLKADGSEKVTEQVRVTALGLTRLSKLMSSRLAIVPTAVE